MEEFVQIVEVSPRDGIQNEKKNLNYRAKTRTDSKGN